MRIFIVILLSLGLVGCATVNFSSKYYTLPENYKDDIALVFNTITKSISLKYAYAYRITKDNETATPGVPQNENCVISIPDYFIRYVYEFYYNNRFEIFICLFLHEIAHSEFNLPSEPPKTHYLCDREAIEKLLKPYNTLYGVNDFYSTLCVIDNYWRARKGLGGHFFNIGWNALNAISLFYGGSGSIGDLYAVDIATRVQLMRRDYRNVKFIFKRSQKDNTITTSGNINFDSISSSKIIPEEKTKSREEEESKKLTRWLACESIRRGSSETEVKKILGEPDSIEVLPQTVSTRKEINPFYPLVWIYKDNLRVEFSSTNGKEYRVSSRICSELKN